jgi:hypothetical protein
VIEKPQIRQTTLRGLLMRRSVRATRWRLGISSRCRIRRSTFLRVGRLVSLTTARVSCFSVQGLRATRT